LTVALATGTAVGNQPLPPQAIAGFHTRTIECIVYDYLYDELVKGELICNVNAPGRAVSMMSSGRAQRLPHAEPVGEPTYGSLLRVGKSWRFGRAFACTRMRAQTLTCANRLAHGWVFDVRGRVRLF